MSVPVSSSLVILGAADATPRGAWGSVVVVGLLAFAIVGAALLVVRLVTRVLDKIPQSPQRLTTYECGEEPIGSAWIQFDLRFYVVALLFVIFDVEIAFFFPWAVVFGAAHRAGDETLPIEQRVEAALLRSSRGARTP